ncbi:MAG: helix-turn-helix domain-containing protein [Acidimicrobiia bacterium]|nr:helix-turn-helix domain-containing protein [Acidimicrobiia bacterium]
MALRQRRTERGWSQAELAERAGVSRQLVSAVESGRHEPGVAAALALARALGESVEALFVEEQAPLDAVAVLGDTRPAGPVRAGLVRGRAVVTPVSPLDELDGVVPEGRWSGTAVQLADGAQPAALVLAGCEPALGMLAGLLSDPTGALWVKASSGDARAALAAGRVHVAAVHERSHRLPSAPADVVALEVARWRVGVAYDPRLASSAADAVDSGAPVVQREPGAGAQKAFDRWVRREHRTRPSGPRASGHVEVCRMVAMGVAAGGVTAEPAAVAAGLGFESLEEHVVALWCPRDLLGERAVAEVLDHLTTAAFRSRLAGLPAYDVAGLGTEIA